MTKQKVQKIKPVMLRNEASQTTQQTRDSSGVTMTT
jgi:hypothetical protein